MSSIRLAVYMKDSILDALMERAFKERRDALKARKLALGDKVYKRLYTAAEIKAIKKVAGEFIRTRTGLNVKFGGDFCNVSWGEDRPSSREREGTLILNASDPLTDEYRDIEADKKKLGEDERRAKLEAQGKLNSASTVQRLIEIWPEVKPLAEPYLKVKRAPLPVLQNDVLNKTFKLPVEPVKKVAKKARRA